MEWGGKNFLNKYTEQENKIHVLEVGKETKKTMITVVSTICGGSLMVILRKVREGKRRSKERIMDGWQTKNNESVVLK